MPSDVARTLARRVLETRTRRSLTQAALAEATGVSDETISRIERGRYEPALSTVCSLAAALGVSIDYLVGANEKPSSAIEPDENPLVRQIAERAKKLGADAQRALLATAKVMPETGTNEHKVRRPR